MEPENSWGRGRFRNVGHHQEARGDQHAPAQKTTRNKHSVGNAQIMPKPVALEAKPWIGETFAGEMPGPAAPEAPGTRLTLTSSTPFEENIKLFFGHFAAASKNAPCIKNRTALPSLSESTEASVEPASLEFSPWSKLAPRRPVLRAAWCTGNGDYTTPRINSMAQTCANPPWP